MENNFHVKCSSKIHQDINASSYCQECRIYMCEKCQKIHEELYDHNRLIIKENQTEIFTGICREKDHKYNLDLFCKTHNKLVCLACVSKINKDGYGQHKDCDIYIIDDIKEEKKVKFKENLKELNDLNNSVLQSINQLKKTFDEINNKKEEMKIQIQKIFTKLRNELNNREDKLLAKIDEKFDNMNIKEIDIKLYEKIPKKIQKLLDEINLINKEWDAENLSYYLNCCSEIETNIINIKKEKESLKNSLNSKLFKIDYNPKDNEIKEILEKIQSFGSIYYEFEFESCKNKLNEMPEYILSGEKENIVTKKSKQNWIRILSKNILEQQKEYNFRIKIIKSKSKKIMIGIAQTEPDLLGKVLLQVLDPKSKSIFKRKCFMYYLINNKDDIILNYGWYFSINSLSLFSDSPHNYRGKGVNFIINPDEIKININMKEGTFNLLVDDDIVQLYNNIPLNKPISPAILLYDEEDSIEIQPL